MQTVNVSAMSFACGLSVKRLRYALDHRLVRGTEKSSRGHRVTRQFTPYEGFSIAVAAWMLEAGLRRQVVSQYVRVLSEPFAPWQNPRSKLASLMLPESGVTAPRQIVERVPLWLAMWSREPVRLSVGDVQNLRLSCTSGPKPFDTGWFQATTGATLKNFSPVVEISIDVGRFARAFQKMG